MPTAEPGDRPAAHRERGEDRRGAPAIVVADQLVDTAAVAGELPAGWAARVRSEGKVPAGSGIAAVLAGPGSEVSAAVLEALPDLRVVVVTSMGWDHVDADAARARGVAVVGVEPYCVDEVAEHAIALVLDLLRGVTRLDASVRSGSWDYASLGRPVAGAALGLVGLGRIGAAVAWRAAALGMAVSAYDPVLGGGADAPGGVRIVGSLDELVSGSDVVSVHVPLSPATAGLVDEALLARFRPGSYLVNVSRGEVVTEAALGAALLEGRLGGAALDVLAREPPSKGDPVLAFPRTVITPHAAWYSPAAIERLSRSAGRALARVLGSEEAPGAQPGVAVREGRS